MGDELSEVIRLINVQRQEAGLQPLTQHSKLMASAQVQASYMARTGRMTHTGSWFSSPGGRMRTAGYHWTVYGECIGWGQQSSQAIVDEWMGEYLHRAILLNPDFTHIGVSEVNNFWCADFATGEADG